MATATDEDVRPLVDRNEDGTLPEEALAANQLFTPDQLPDPEVWKSSGLAGNGQVVPEHLVISEEDAASHPLGPEPGHLLRAARARAVEERLGWQRDVSKARQSVAVTKPDETTRTVQGASIAQAKILAGTDPDKAVKETERELAKAAKQVEKSPDGSGASGSSSKTSDDDKPKSGDNKATWLTYARTKGYSGQDDEISLEELKEKYGK